MNACCPGAGDVPYEIGFLIMGLLRADMSQYYPLKAVIEAVLGTDAYLTVKESASLPCWRTEVRRLLGAIGRSIEDTVDVADDQWRREVQEQIDLGDKLLGSADDVDELFAALAATVTRLSFLQVGLLPRPVPGVRRRPIRKGEWRLDTFRTVQYVQRDEQRKALKRHLEARASKKP